MFKFVIYLKSVEPTMEPIDGRTDRGVAAEDLEPKDCDFITELTMLIPDVTRLDGRTELVWLLDWFDTENVLDSWLQIVCASQHCIG